MILKLIRDKLLCLALRIVIKVILITSKIKIIGEDNIELIIKNKLPMLMCVWHGRLLFPCIWAKTRRKKPWIVASNHRDAQIIVNIFKKWNFKIIRGSSGKGGKKVTDKMEMIFCRGEDNWIGVTNDGPKGPIQIAKPGSIKTAIKSKANIVSITGSSSKAWRFNTWDEFMLPKPFSTIIINISKPLQITDDYNLNDINDFINKEQLKADTLINL